MRSIIQWVVRNGPAVNTVMVAAIIVGVIAMLGLKKELFPEFQLEIVTVTVPYPGASPSEVEEGICQKIEEAIRAVDGIKKISSTSSEGMGTVIAEMFSNVRDPQRVLNEIRSEVDQIPSFPLLAEDPDVKLLTIRQPAIRVAVFGGSPTPEGLDPGERRAWELREDVQLRDLAEGVRSDLLDLPAVSLVELLAVRDYQIDVEIPEQTLRRHNLTLQQVGQIIRRENIELPAGEIKSPSSEFLVRGKNRRLTGDEIAELPLLTRPDGVVLRVKDLGTVRDGFTDDAQRSWIRFPSPLADPGLEPAFEGELPAIVMMVQKTRSEDLIEIVSQVYDYVEGLDLPPGYRVAIFDDESILVSERLETLTTNALQGLGLVFIVLALFLEIRLALWVALGIPASIGVAFIIMAGADVTLNMVSTFAFLLALGIVVDDAIVVGENIYRHREMGKSPMRSAIDGATEVAAPVMASVTTTIFAFLPMFFVAGVLGKVIFIMPIVVCGMLIGSLGESLLILPNHLAHRRAPILGTLGRFVTWLLAPLFAWAWLVRSFRRRRAETRAERSRQPNPVSWAYFGVRSGIDGGLKWIIERAYEPSLRTFLRAPVLFVSGMLAILIGSLGLVASGKVPFVVFPEFDSNYITASVSFPAGTPVSVTEEATRRIAEEMERLHAEVAEQSGRPVVRTISRSVGYQEMGAGPGGSLSSQASNIGMVFAEMVGGAERPVSSFELTRRWREASLARVHGFDEIKFTAGNAGPGGKPIEFQLVGKDMAALEDLAEQAKAHLATYDGVFDIADDSKPGKPEIQLRVKPSAEALGIDTNALAETVRTTFYGEEVMRLQRGRHEVKLMVRNPPEQRESLANLREIRIRTSGAGEVPIDELASIDVQRGYSAINRIDQQRSITVTADIDEAEANAREITARLQTEFMPEVLEEYPGVSVRWEGQEQETQESFGSLLIGFPIAMFGMFVLLTSQFRSYLQPLFILLIVPFGLVGAVWGHLLMGLPITLFSVFGLVALSGVIINDSIVLIDFINGNVNRGMPVRRALREAGKARFRPVLLTTLTTVAALLPLLTEKSLQVQVLIPMAVSLAFGLAFGTLVVLMLVPCIYAIYADALDALGFSITDDHHLEDELPLSVDPGTAGGPHTPAPGPAREPVHASPDDPSRSPGA